jgi:glycerol-3-phosphate dehydrogenase
MKRDLAHLASRKYDLLVIGGGITGANIAWDATLRGLRVALLEKGDFGGATSANSLKTVHGGLRYLQDANIRLVRKMVKERKALLHIAPHLVQPLPVVMPTIKGKLMRGKLALGTAVKLNDLASFDRNIHMDPARTLPNGRILSRHQLFDIMPGLADNNISGGVMWHDAQMQNTERLLLSFLLSAVELGAQVANYVRVNGFLQEQKQIVGVTAVDELTGTPLELQARLVLNAAGPWIDELLSTINASIPQPKFHLSTAMNLVTRQILPNHAIGLTGHYMQALSDGSAEKRSRVLFVAPWENYSIVGTLHAPYTGQLADQWVTERMITDFLAELNHAYPGARLQREDVYHVHQGFLPMLPNDADPTIVKLIREGQVIDHFTESGLPGLLTVIGVKYTTARYLAEKTVNKVFEKLQRPSPTCQTRIRRLYGGKIRHYETFVAASMEQWPVEMPPYQLRRLIQNYGSTHRHLLAYMTEDVYMGQPVAADTAVTRAEIIHAVRAEMAQKLCDVVLRRTEMGAAGKPSDESLEATAIIMAAELEWNAQRIEKEVEEVQGNFRVAM